GLVAGIAKGSGQRLDVGLGVRQVAQLLRVVLADADEQSELLAGRISSAGRDDRHQERQDSRGHATGWTIRHGTPRGCAAKRAAAGPDQRWWRSGSARLNLTAIPPDSGKSAFALFFRGRAVRLLVRQAY